VGDKGYVYAVELVPDLVEMGRQNCEQLGIKNVGFYHASGKVGLTDRAPFDRILVSAGANKVPGELINQLKPGGKMVIPVKYDILEIIKSANDELKTISHEGFLFVPLKRPSIH
jgi:protein-L-isoaspartate(D-aspartate) O-methyltransferase